MHRQRVMFVTCAAHTRPWLADMCAVVFLLAIESESEVVLWRNGASIMEESAFLLKDLRCLACIAVIMDKL